MSEKWVYWFEELDKDAVDIVGKKCANLGEMSRIGLPVPLGFAVSTKAYERFMAESGALDEVGRCLADLWRGPMTITQWEHVSQALRKIIINKELPPDIGEAIAKHYRILSDRCGTEDLPVAVRSSGPISMPGQFETYLNVVGVDEVLAKVVECWTSTFTSQAIAYRAQKGMRVDSSPVGVAVQRVVKARSAGVGFTAHPTTGDRNKMVIEGVWGMGETVVGGTATPDRFVIDKETLETQKSISLKATRIVLKERGTAVEVVPTELQFKPCLDDRELAKLVELGKTLEKYYGCPQDIEWVVADDIPFPSSVFLVQTRPVKDLQPQRNTTEKIIDLMLDSVFKM